jgi:hypothetical protein
MYLQLLGCETLQLQYSLMETRHHPLQSSPIRLAMAHGSCWLCHHFGAREGAHDFLSVFLEQSMLTFGSKPVEKLWAIL